MNSICKVAACDRPVAEGFVCMNHTRQLERALGDIPATIHQLNITLTKGGRFADRNERCGAETPLPLDPRASEAAGNLRAHLVGWVRLVAEERGLALPADADDAMSRWLLAHVEWLRHHEAGHEAVDELVGDVRQARRVIDVPANRTTFPVGPCPESTLVPTSTPAPIGYTYAIEGYCGIVHFCTGEVRAYIPNDPAQPARLECTTCHTTWEPWQWLRAGRRILDRKQAMKGTAA